MSAVLDPSRTGAPEVVAPAAPARLAAILALVAAVVGSVLGPTGGFDVLLGGDAIRVAAGEVEALHESTWERVRLGERIAGGTTIRTLDGVATLDVPGGVVDLAAHTRLVTGADLTLQVGTAVVQTPRVAVGDGVVAAQGAGTWRYDAMGRVGVYEGATLLTDATEREVLVRPLEQVHVRDGAAENRLRPYVYVGTDPFDQKHLGPALRVDDLVSALRRGLTADYGTTPQPAAFYTDFDGLDGQLVGLLGDVGFERDGDRIGPPADVLVASVVTEALVVDAGLAPAEAADEVRTKRLAGATWGLIVQARELDASHVRAAADRALTRRQQLEQQGTATPLLPPPPSDTAPASSPPDPTDGTGSAPDPESPPAGDRPPADDDGPTDDEPSGPVGDTIDDLGADDVLPDPLDDTVDGVVETVDDLLGTAGSTVEDTSDTLGTVVDGLLGGN